MLKKNAAAQVLSPAYQSIEHSFAGHIHGFTAMEHGAYYGGNLKHNRFDRISRKFYTIRNHILLFSAFLATFLITIFLKKIPIEKFEFSVVVGKLKFFCNFP